ncbi:MAG: hypothetical protein WA951_04230 [Leeuwenhoekiella sp.]
MKNSIILAVLLLSCVVCIYMIYNGDGKNNRIYVLINAAVAAFIFGRIAYNQRHDHWVQYSPWRIVFNLDGKKRVIKLKDVNEIVLTEKSVEIKRRNTTGLRVNLGDYTKEEIERFVALFRK